jgi:hypothetical protein
MSITVGNQTLASATCGQCGARLYPPSDLAAHVAQHIKVYENPIARYHGGRTPGTRNRYRMSGTGVERKSGIRRVR